MLYLGIALLVIGAIFIFLTVVVPTFGIPLWVGIAAMIAGVVLCFIPARRL